MLNDDERQALDAIERGIAARDPGLDRYLSSGGECRFPTMFVLGVLFILTVPVVGLFADGPAILLTVSVFATAMIVAAARRRSE
jgi:hypothetical protein